MYRKANLEEEGGEDDNNQVGSNGNGGKEGKNGNNDLRSSDITEIVPDKNLKTYLIFIIGLISLCIPSIVHCAWRFTENNQMKKRLDYLLANTIIHVGDYSFKWRQQDLFATQCPQMAFCSNFTTAKEKLKAVSNTVRYKFEYVQRGYSGDDFFSNYLYRAEDINPITGEVVCPSGDVEVRCNVNYDGPELVNYPPSFALKTTLGSGIYIPYSYEGSLALSDTASIANLSINTFWTTWLATPVEGKELTQELIMLESTIVTQRYNLSKLASSVTYGFSLGLSLVMFLIIFSNIKSNLQNESKHNRSILFMIPIDVVKRNKAILDYVDRVFLDLSG